MKNKYILRGALAGLLCSLSVSQLIIVHHPVAVAFSIFGCVCNFWVAGYVLVRGVE